jgi:hypothetical protein
MQHRRIATYEIWLLEMVVLQPFLKMVVIHGFNTTIFKMLQNSVAIGGRYCNGEKWLQ